MNKELRELLYLNVKRHYGLLSQIADRAGVSHSFVSMVLKGQRENDNILDLAVSMLKQAHAENKIQQDILNQAMKKASL